MAVGEKGGTGFLLRQSEPSDTVVLLTNFHVLNGGNTPRVMNRRHDFVLPSGYSCILSESHDICVVDVSLLLSNPSDVEFSTNDIKFASNGQIEAVCAGWPVDEYDSRIGDPINSEPEFLSGVVDQERVLVQCPPSIRFGMKTFIDLSKGHSGSPLWTKSEDGQIKIIGMYAFIAGKYNGGSDQRFSVHGSDLKIYAEHQF